MIFKGKRMSDKKAKKNGHSQAGKGKDIKKEIRGIPVKKIRKLALHNQP